MPIAWSVAIVWFPKTSHIPPSPPLRKTLWFTPHPLPLGISRTFKRGFLNTTLGNSKWVFGKKEESEYSLSYENTVQFQYKCKLLLILLFSQTFSFFAIMFANYVCVVFIWAYTLTKSTYMWHIYGTSYVTYMWYILKKHAKQGTVRMFKWTFDLTTRNTLQWGKKNIPTLWTIYLKAD